MLAKQREIMESHDGLVARLISAEEAIKAKDEEVKQMKSDLETVPVLRAQVRTFNL